MIRAAFIIAVIGLAQPVSSQDSIGNAMQSFQEIITEIVMQSEDNPDMDEFADRLMQLAENPVKINYADINEIGQLFWLSDLQIQKILEYMKANGPLMSVYEISYIEGFSEKDAKMLLPFISFEKKEKNDSISTGIALKYGKHKLLLRSYRVLEKQKGYNGSFSGGPSAIYARYSYQWNNRIFAGFTGESDAGETFMKGRNGFDFNSGYIQFNSNKFIKTVILGDYRVSFGQGLNVWTGFNFGKSTGALSSMGRATGISRYQSSDENRFFRGAAARFNLKPFEFTIWYSSHPVDANIVVKDSLSGKAKEASSLQTTGIHALSSEINDEDAVVAKCSGINFSLVKTRFIAGITAMHYSYSARLNPSPEAYNTYYFRGSSNYNLSFDYRYRIRNVILFGEEAFSRNGGLAFLNGIRAYVNSRFSLSFISRHYQKDYQAMYGNAFGENSRNANESGVYAGVELKALKNTVVSGYADVFRFPWISYTADMPSIGRDLVGQVLFTPTDRLQLYLQYRNKTKEMNYSEPSEVLNSLEKVSARRWRCSMKISANQAIQLITRLDWSDYDPEFSTASKGFLVSQDLEFSFRRFPLKTSIRYLMFDTDDYNSRIYAYENDLLYTFSVPAFSDEGFKTYILFKYSPTSYLDLWLKYSVLQYADKGTIGSGMYEISGNKKSEIKVQAVVKF